MFYQCFSLDEKKSHFKLYSNQENIINKKQIRTLNLVTRNIKQLLNYQTEVQIYPRTLISPDVGVYNNGLDNENHDLIVRLNDTIINHKVGTSYRIQDLIGQGTFGKVYKCIGSEDKSCFAIKIIKNINAYSLQATKEIKLLRFLNKKQNNNSIISLKDYFIFNDHVCIVFPLLEFTLEELLQETKYQGLSLYMIKSILKQVIIGLEFMHSLNWVHCDIKPENILFVDNQAKKVQIIDFGSGSEVDVNLHLYIQSLYYRAPEILLGYNKTTAIDMWSVGCVAVQLYLGYPIFQGSSSFDQLSKILKLIPNDNYEIIAKSPKCNKYFQFNGSKYMIKEIKQYQKEQSIPQPGIETFTNIQELYLEYNKSSLRTIQEMAVLDSFVDLIKKLLIIDPKKRLTASQCLQHPFLREVQEFNIRDLLRQENPS